MDRPAFPEILSVKADGRTYTRPTRRLARLIDTARNSPGLATADLTAAATDNTGEFLWFNGSRWGQIAPARVRDYIAFGRLAGFLDGDENTVSTPADFDVAFSGDAHWASVLSSQALSFLQTQLGESSGPATVKALKSLVTRLNRAEREPTVSALAKALGITSATDEERFRWGLMIHIDGPLAKFEVRHQPRLAWTG